MAKKEKIKLADIAALFANYTGDYKPTEEDWGPDVGKEVN